MYKSIRYVLLICVGVVTSVNATVSVTDDEGHIVTLQEPAKRIISLAPHITESLFAAGAGDKIIAAVSYSDYPEAAKKIPRVGGYPSLDVEKIVSLKPDLIVAWSTGNNKEQVNKLQELGITVFLSEPRYPMDIAKTIQRFGVLAGTNEIANKASSDFLQHYQYLKTTYSKKKKVKVFYQIWNKPIMTISGNHLISEVINLCGGINVFTNLKTLTPQVSLESVLASKAEVIISGGMGKERPEWLEEWKQWSDFSAVKNNHLYFIDPNLMQRVGPRILLGADKLCELLDRVRP